MSDLISRSDLLKCFCVTKDGRRIPEVDCDNMEVTVSIKDVKKIIRRQPTIEAVPVVERNKIIDEFAEMCKADIMCQTFGLHPINIDKIAEQMKGGTK